MATRGYQSYRGRNHGKLALVIVLVLILLAAVGYLVAQEYMVYDDEGHRHLELPFLKKGQTEQPQQPEDTTPDDVDLIIDEPERPLLKELHARQLPDTVLTEDPSAVLAEHPEAVVIPVKLRDGTVTYDTQTAARDTVTTGGPETLTSLKTLLSGDTWTVARIACFADMDFANAKPDEAGLLRTGDGWLWYDDDAACWLDPGKAAAREYLVQLCKECAELGFDENSAGLLHLSCPWPSGPHRLRLRHQPHRHPQRVRGGGAGGPAQNHRPVGAGAGSGDDGRQRRRRHPRPADGALRPHLCGYGHRGRSGPARAAPGGL